jgi:hypothetical protein
VPYRRSKLTLLLKDVFDIGCTRLCATVVIAAVSPLAKDVAHSANTIGCVAPINNGVMTGNPPYCTHVIMTMKLRTKARRVCRHRI